MQTPAPYKKPTLPNLSLLLESVKHETMQQLNCVKIGVIQAFHPGDDTHAPSVDVHIAFTQVTSVAPDGTRTFAQYAPLLNVPVSFQQGGGCIATFPIVAGDECIILFNDRQLDNWLISGAGQAPTVNRAHDFSDALAIVGVRSNPRGISGISTTTAQLRSIDGETYVEVDPAGNVNIVAPATINLTAPTVNINASSAVNITTPITTISGVINVENVDSASNPFTVSGKITATGDIIAGTVSVESHEHSGVTPGGGNTGPPV